jgi:hypothetical protein
MTAEREAFFAALRNRLFPVLRAQGFRGSGTTLRRISEPVVHVVNVQGSSTGQRCYVNLGAHLSFLPGPGGGYVPDCKLLEYQCVFRRRVDPEPTYQFGWPYAPTSVVIPLLVSSFEQQAGAFFRALSAFPGTLLSVSPDDFLSPSREAAPFMSATPYVFVLIHQRLGNTSKAKEFARVGLDTVSPSASSLRALYERLLGAA